MRTRLGNLIKLLAIFALCLPLAARSSSAGTLVDVDKLIARYSKQQQKTEDLELKGSAEKAIQVFEEIKRFKLQTSDCSESVQVDIQAVIFYDAMLHKYSRFIHRRTNRMSLYFLFEEIEKHKSEWFEMVKKNPYYKPALTLRIGSSSRLVNLTLDPIGERIFMDFGIPHVVGHGAHKEVLTKVEYGTGEEVVVAVLSPPVYNPSASQIEADKAKESYENAKRAFEREKKIISELIDPNFPKEQRKGLVEAYAVIGNEIVMKKYNMDLEAATQGKVLADGTQVGPLPLTESDILNLFSGMTQGLVTLQTHPKLGYVHRDIKPANMLIEIVPPESPHQHSEMNMVLADYGISEKPKEYIAAPRTVGTPGFMSLEVITKMPESEESFSKSDVFSNSVALAMILRPELAPWLHECNPDDKFVGCFWRYLNKTSRRAKAGVFQDPLSQFLLKGITLGPYQRTSLLDWQRELDNYRKSKYPELLYEDRIKDQALRLANFKEREKQRIEMEDIPRRREEIQKLIANHEQRMKMFGLFGQGRHVTEAEREQFQSLKVRVFDMDDTGRFDPQTEKIRSVKKARQRLNTLIPGASSIVWLYSEKHDGKYRLGLMYKDLDGKIKVKKLYVDFRQKDLRHLEDQISSEIEYYGISFLGEKQILEKYKSQLFNSLKNL